MQNLRLNVTPNVRMHHCQMWHLLNKMLNSFLPSKTYLWTRRNDSSRRLFGLSIQPFHSSRSWLIYYLSATFMNYHRNTWVPLISKYLPISDINILSNRAYTEPLDKEVLRLTTPSVGISLHLCPNCSTSNAEIVLPGCQPAQSD